MRRRKVVVKCVTVGVHDVRQGSAPSSDLLSAYDSIVHFFNQLHTSQPQRGPTLLNASHVQSQLAVSI